MHKGLNSLLLSLFFLFIINENASAQAFNSLEIGVSTSALSIQDKSYSNRWNLTPSRSFQVRTPFYIGIAGIGVDIFDYESIDAQVSDFESVNFSAYLGFNPISVKHFTLSTGALVGIQRTNGISLTINSLEREQFFGLSIEPKFSIGSFILFGDFQYRRVFNFQRQNILFAGGGIRVNLKLPESIYTLID